MSWLKQNIQLFFILTYSICVSIWLSNTAYISACFGAICAGIVIGNMTSERKKMDLLINAAWLIGGVFTYLYVGDLREPIEDTRMHFIMSFPFISTTILIMNLNKRLEN
ncbi:hypothetical protein A3715_19315 [Oleiphilus sp. HI0009]|nr:hypothetical protein A3715_19315 [Oleiphilus sp. HI0009]